MQTTVRITNVNTNIVQTATTDLKRRFHNYSSVRRFLHFERHCRRLRETTTTSIIEVQVGQIKSHESLALKIGS